MSSALGGLLDCWESLFGHVADLDECLFRDALRSVARVAEADRAALMVLDTPAGALLLKAALGPPRCENENAGDALDEAIGRWVLKHRRPLLLCPDEETPASLVASVRGAIVAPFVSVPIVFAGEMLGVMNLAREENGNPFDHAHLQLASIAGLQVGAFLHLSRLDDRLAERERFITRILESIPSSLLVVDARLRVVSANRNFLDKTRRTKKATEGRKLADILSPALIEQTRMVDKVKEAFSTGRTIEGGKVAYRAPNLPTHVYFYRLIPIPAGDDVQEIMLLMDDVTEQEKVGADAKRAERHLASVVECANDFVISLDREGRLVSWNPAAERVSGWSFDKLQGKTLAELCTAEDRDAMVHMIQRLAAGSGVQGRRVRLVTSDGRELTIAWSCSPMCDDQGTVVGMVAVGRDLTEQLQLEQQLIQSDKMASLGVMAGGIAHELRNPLALIAVSAQLLLEKQDDPEFRESCLERINASTKRASLIIENLLKFARPQADKVGQISVCDLLDDTFLLLSDQLVLQKVRLRRKRCAGGVTVPGNPDLLQQVFANLVLNACNAMPRGGDLRVSTSVGEDRKVRISFQDSGEGIPPDNLPRLFDPFFTTKPPGGSFVGLGLSISYSIIKQHFGSIEVQSRVGKGSTFTVSLPQSRGVHEA